LRQQRRVRGLRVRPAFEYNRSGFFHIAVTAPDPRETCARAVKEGGKQIGEAVYVSDLWGNTVEILSSSFEQLMANKG
jgi:catechol-2,3-dioxygenase